VGRFGLILSSTKKIMKAVLFLVTLGACIGVDSAPAQTSRLALVYSPGQVALQLTGTVGTVYAIQYSTNLSSSNSWVDRTLLKARATNYVWTDPSPRVSSNRFYRAVSVVAPADSTLAFIEPGTFVMGSPTNEIGRNSATETQHTVIISRGFWMGKYLVTQAAYSSVVGTNPSSFRGDLSLPVESVSWDDATNYCALRTQQEQAAGLVPTNFVYRLPTESEWEYACRAGTTNAFYLGSGLYSGQANFNGNYGYDSAVGEISSNGIYLQATSPVGSYSANPWGLYDMIGNVLEWCQDFYSAQYPAGPVVDPQGGSSSQRTLRGGYWYAHPMACRSAIRYGYGPTLANYTIGFRIVLAQRR